MKKPDLRTFAQWLDPYLVAELESRRRLKKEWHWRRLVTSLLDPILFPASDSPVSITCAGTLRLSIAIISTPLVPPPDIADRRLPFIRNSSCT